MEHIGTAMMAAEGLVALAGFAVLLRAHREARNVDKAVIEELRSELNRLARYRNEVLGREQGDDEI